MTPLQQRFLSYVDHRFAVRDPRRRWVIGTLVLGLIGIALALLALRYGRPLYAAPLFPVALLLVGRNVLALMRMHRARRRLAQMREVIRHGVPVSAYVVRPHDGLMRPSADTLPCQALFTFDPDVAADAGYLRYLAQRWAEETPDEIRAQLYSRRRLPDSITDGSTVYCGDVFVPATFLPGGHLTGGPMPCIAEPGDTGGIEVVPYWLLFPALHEDRPASDRPRV